VRPFDSIYAPRSIGGQSKTQIQLAPDTSNVPISEGNFNDNPSGSATVPYDQVYGDYRDSVNEALNSNYIPLGLRDVVKGYFSSLEPKK
jgi:hypothetical protein